MAEPVDIIQASNEQLSGKEKTPIKDALRFYKKTLGQNFETVMRESYSRTQGAFYANLINARKLDIHTYGLRTSARKLGYSLEDIKQFKPDELTTIVHEKRIKPIDPVKVEQQVTPPPPPTADVQHKIVTQKLQEPKQSDPGRMDSKTIRKKDKRRARAHKDVNPANVKINPETIKGQTKKRTRRERIAAKKDPSYVKYKKRQHTFRKKEWEKKDPESIKIAKENYIKNPSRIFKDDVKNVWEDIKNTGKRFYNDSPTMKTTKNLLSKKWFRGGLWAVGSTIAFNLVRDKVARALEPPRAIPEEYERGYDNIKQTLTDFGSPVKLAKAAQKVMVPYYSTTRSALRTNVNTVINHNYALASSKHAIRHMQY